MSDITITHTHAEGTLIEGSRKGDGVWEVLKGLGANWRYFRSLGQIGLGQSRDKAAKTWAIDRASEALRKAGHEVTVSVDDCSGARSPKRKPSGTSAPRTAPTITRRLPAVLAAKADAAFGR